METIKRQISAISEFVIDNSSDEEDYKREQLHAKINMRRTQQIKLMKTM